MSKTPKRQPAPAPRKVIIVDTDPVFRQNLTKSIGGETDLQLCGSVATAAAGLIDLASTGPDLVLLNLALTDKSGLELIKQIRKTNKKVKLLVISMHDETVFANQVLRAGGDGYIKKDEDPDEIIHAIRDVLNGHIYISEEIVSGVFVKRKSRTRYKKKKLRRSRID